MVERRAPDSVDVHFADRMEAAKVLVVDDQQANLVAVSKLLSSLSVQVFIAASGASALALILRHQFAVVLLDVQMPEMDGYETAALIRDHTERDPVPIVFLTAGDREEQKIAQGYAAGAIDYLFKPVNPSLLLSKVRVFVELNEHRRRLRNASIELKQKNLQLKQLVQAVGEGILGIDTDGSVTLVNSAACAMLQAPAAELYGRSAASLLNIAPASERSSPFARAIQDGVIRDDNAIFQTTKLRPIPVEYTLSVIRATPDAEPSFVLVFKDVTERRAVSERLRILAETDFLTGLANRQIFEQRLTRLIEEAGQRHADQFAVAFIDLDRFKPINDRFGHAVGDLVLKAVAQRLMGSTREGDLCARLGGDEFAVVLIGVNSDDEVLRISKKLIDRVAEPISCNGILIEVTISVGVALFPRDGASLDEIVRTADVAMYRAKQSMGGKPVVVAGLHHPGDLA